MKKGKDKKNTLAQVISVLPLTTKELEQVKAQLTVLLGRPVLVRNIIQKDILGGLKIIIEGKIIDVSLAGQLGQLEDRFRQLIKSD